MIKLWSLIPTPYKIGGLFALCAVVLLGLGIIGYKIYSAGYDNAVAECNLQKQTVINRNVSIRKKQNEIPRGDVSDTINSLRNGEF